MKNYVKLKRRNIFRYQYLYLDHEDYFADKIFIEHKLRIHFGKEYVRDKGVFRVICVSFPKKREKDFLECMKELEKRIMIMGPDSYKYYKDICESVVGELNYD